MSRPARPWSRRAVLLWLPVPAYISLVFLASALTVPRVPAMLGDKVAHAIEFAGLGLLTCRAVRGHAPSGSRWLGALAAWAFVVASGAVDEWIQSFVPLRTSDLLDLLADAIGGLVGVLCWLVGERLLERRRAAADLGGAASLALVAALVGAACNEDRADSGSDTASDASAPDSGERDAAGADGGTDRDASASGDAPAPRFVPDTGPGADGGDRPPRAGGALCERDADCRPQQYCERRFGDAYCAPAPGADGAACSTDRDCDLADSEDLFCCATVAFGERICMRLDDGDVCGDRAGTQGDPCIDGSHSACRLDSHFCLWAGSDHARCTQFCGPTFDRCPDSDYCLYVAGPWGFCMPTGGTRGELQPCMDDPLGCQQQTLCINGTERAGYPYAYCASLCQDERDCAVEDTCTPIGTCEPQGEIPLGGACVEDRFACGVGLVCGLQHTRAAECTRFCDEEWECGAGTYCFEVESLDAHLGVCRSRGTDSAGDFCGDDPAACPGVCTGGYRQFDPGGYCLPQCSAADPCPTGARCEAIDGVGSLCMPDGSAVQGESCALDPFACAADHLCVHHGTAHAFCALRCYRGEPCPAGTWCTAEGDDWGVCHPGGAVPAGASCDPATLGCAPGSICAGDDAPRCFARCTDDPLACPAGHVCLEATRGETTRWCYPSGARAYGADCDDDPYACAHPDFCADLGSGLARCTRRCDADADCPGPDWCFRTADGGWCRPAGGSVPPGGSCEGDPTACTEGSLCVLGGERGSFCANDCTGFAARCPTTSACRFLGWGLNLCVPRGTAGHGASCARDRFACDDRSWCVNAGTEDAVCVRTCSFDSGACPEGTRCQYLSGGFGVCIAAGLSPSDPLNPGGAPL